MGVNSSYNMGKGCLQSAQIDMDLVLPCETHLYACLPSEKGRRKCLFRKFKILQM